MTTYAAALSAAAGAASGPTPGVLVGVGLVVLVFLGWVYRLLTAHGRAARRSRVDGDGPRGGDAPGNGPGSGQDSGPDSGHRS